MKKVLIACEKSQAVTKAFRDRGFEAYSCDVQETTGNPDWHILGDVTEVLDGDWDLIIAHPPCTHLSVSGARWFTEGRKPWSLQEDAAAFFMKCVNAKAKFIAVENPISVMSTKYRKPDQIIQPWQFGHPESKATCLWLKGLPKLVPTNILEKTGKYWHNQTPSGQNKLGPSKDRAEIRAKTYTGIAEAMAEQWGNFIIQNS